MPGQWVHASALKNSSSPGPKDGPRQNGASLEYMSSEINRTFSSTDYENVPSNTAGFVTNDIYETCRTPSTMEAGWVENDIYGYWTCPVMWWRPRLNDCQPTWLEFISTSFVVWLSCTLLVTQCKGHRALVNVHPQGEQKAHFSKMLCTKKHKGVIANSSLHPVVREEDSAYANSHNNAPTFLSI